MSLAQKAKAGPPPRTPHGCVCGVGKLLTGLPKAEGDALRAMLAEDSGWQHRQIASVLVDEGHTVGRKSVERHRRMECACAERGVK